MKSLKAIFIFLISLQAGAALAGSRVTVQLTDLTNVRVEHRGQVLVSEYTLPAGSLVEVSTDEYQQAPFMRFWDSLIGQEQKPEAFVKNITLISAPGYSGNDIKEFNDHNSQDSLYVAKKVLDTAAVIDNSEGHEQFRTRKAAPVMESQDVVEHEKPVMNRRIAGHVVDRILQGNRSAKVTGTAQEHCEACEGEFYNRFVRAGVPENGLRKALEFYKTHQSRIRNKRYITISDFSQHSTAKRMFILDMQTGSVEKHIVSNGKASDPANNGYMRSFGNNAHKTPKGFLLSGETYIGHKGYSMRLDGLEAGNSSARRRAIVMHPAAYMNPGWIRKYGKPGRSWGCLALPTNESRAVIDKIKGGSLIYNYDGE